MAIDKKVDEILIEFGIRLEQDLQDSLATKMGGAYNARLSSKIKSLPIKHVGDLTQYILSMPEYGKVLDKGRGKTKNSGDGAVQKGVEDWVKRRALVGKFQNDNLQQRLSKQAQNKTNRPKKPLKKLAFDKAVKQLSYLIARKIHREGYKGNQFFSEVINDGRLEQLEKDLIEATQTEILIEIKR
jgi:hypothetical protein